MTPPASRAPQSRFAVCTAQARVTWRGHQGARRMADRNEESKSRKAGKALSSHGAAFAIPALLVTYPLIGGFVGKYLADRYDKPWILAVAVLAGLALALRECVRLIRRLNDSDK